MRRRQRGMTIVELVLLMGVMSAMAIFAAEEIRYAIATSRFTAAAAKVASDIRYAQQLARTRNGWYGVKFLVSPNDQYTVYSTDGTTDTTVADPVNPAQGLQVNVSTAFGGVQIAAASIGGGNQVEFNPTGAPYNDKNGALLGTDGTVTLSLGGATKVITITRNTGRVVSQ